MAVRLTVVRQTDIPDQPHNSETATNKGGAGLRRLAMALTAPERGGLADAGAALIRPSDQVRGPPSPGKREKERAAAHTRFGHGSNNE